MNMADHFCINHNYLLEDYHTANRYTFATDVKHTLRKQASELAVGLRLDIQRYDWWHLMYVLT